MSSVFTMFTKDLKLVNPYLANVVDVVLHSVAPEPYILHGGKGGEVGVCHLIKTKTNQIKS